MARAPRSSTWRRAVAAGVLLFACAAAGAIWFGGSEMALRWLAARAVQASAGRLALEDVRGSLYGRMRIGRLAFEDGDRRVEARALELEWSPRALLFSRTVLIRTIALQGLSVNTGKSSATPPQLPPSLRLPLRLELRQAKIDVLVLASERGRREFRSVTLKLQNPDGRLHAVVSMQTPWGRGDADLRLADTPPFALDGSAGLSREDGPHAYSLHAALTGTLDAVRVSANGTSMGAQADLRVAFAPRAHMPLKQVELRLAHIDAQKFAAGLPHTDIGAELSLRAGDENAVAGELRLTNALAGTLDAARLPLREAQVSFEGMLEALTLNSVRLDLGDAGRFAGLGTLRQDKLTLALQTSALDLHGVHTKLATTKLAGNLKLDATGGIRRVQADLGERAYRVRLDASHRGDAIDVRAAQVSVAGGALMLKGRLSLSHLHEFRAEGALSRFDPSRLGDFPAALINGKLSASGQLSPRAQATLHFSTSDSRYRGHRMQGKFAASLSPERIWDSDIALELGANRIWAQGAFGEIGDRLDWRLEAGNLAALTSGLGGRLSASGTLQGSAAEPSGTLRASARNLVWAGGHRVSELSAEGRIANGIDGPLQLNAALRDYRSATLHIAAATVAAAGQRGAHQVNVTARNAAIDVRAALAGGWRTDLGWTGRILSFDNRGRYAVALAAPANFTFNGANFSLEAATLRFAHGSVRIDELARRGDGIVSAGALSGLDADYLLESMDRPSGIRSTLTLGGSWKFAASDTISGAFALWREQGDLSLISEPATAAGLTRLALSVTAADNRVAAKLQAQGSVLGTISASAHTTLARQGASVGLPGNSALSFDAQLSVPSLAWAKPLTGGGMAVEGSLKAQFGGQGTVAEPHLSGSIAADGLKFEYPELGIYLNGGSLRASLAGNKLMLDRITLRGGAGAVDGEGSITWVSGKTSARIALNAKKFELIKRLDRLLILSGDAEATVEDQQVHASAALKADRGEITLAETDAPTLSADVVVLGRDRNVARKSAPFAAKVELNLDLGEQFHLKGRGIDARLAGALKVRASGNRPPTASGSIRVAQGSYSAYGQRLTIERGILNFAGPLDDPELDIVALRKKQAVETGVAIRGTALAPRISLVSNPSVPDSEKLSWLILGHGMEGANRSELGALQAAAGALLARGDSVRLQDRIAHSVGLDEFDLSGSGGLESAALTLGKRLSSSAYLTFEQGLAAATNLVKITYSLTPHVSVRAQTGSESAVDAFYTFSFR